MGGSIFSHFLTLMYYLIALIIVDGEGKQCRRKSHDNIVHQRLDYWQFSPMRMDQRCTSIVNNLSKAIIDIKRRWNMV